MYLSREKYSYFLSKTNTRIYVFENQQLQEFHLLVFIDVQDADRFIYK